ncbi:MAG: lamin tail domain-containing protein [Deltaproteobacteria bacterium]|nr:lamin tail domain-containing protein [Deltaproteobacteria bacterium]
MKIQFAMASIASLSIAVASCEPDPPKEVKLHLNEIMPSNQFAHADEHGEYDDWLELYNGESEEIDLEGYYVSDSSSDYFKRRLPAGLKIAADGVLLLWADGSIDQGINHLPFKLNATGEDLYLTSPDGDLIDSYQWTNAFGDQSFARFPDGSGDFALCAYPTPDQKNGAACGGQ